jgi:hypothetical protein
VKEDEIAGHVARMEAKKNAYRIFVVKPEGKRTLGRPKLRWRITLMVVLRDIE